MVLDATALSVLSIVKLVIATWLFSRTLPRRTHFRWRVAVVGITIAAATAVGVSRGFSIFPVLTDDLSFVLASLQFVGILALATLTQRALFSCPPRTSIFCCSMAYLLENLSSTVERCIRQYLPFISDPLPLLEALALYGTISLGVFAASYALLVRKIEKNGLLLISNPLMSTTAALVIVINMVFDLIIKDISVPEMGLPRRYAVALNWIYAILCVYIMYSVFEIIYARRLRSDMASLERLRAAEAKRYEMSRENIEAINLKCHDIKHQIRSLSSGGASVDGRVLDDLSREVDVYDSSVRTGNDALDTILTEKSLLCWRRAITLSCIADGAALNFVDPTALYSFFGNALDNVIEAVDRLDDPERRSIGLTVRRVGDMASIHIENYFDGNVELGGDGLPLTRKEDRSNHGFGTRSMLMTVERLGGSLTMGAQGDVFLLDALIPLP